ncbi:Alanine--tRNA ligase [Candidatus Methanoperedenaceae archaeon GB37]|nr:Alanine--tRNA ligase [Candidatus Methanoperedenaceae archaeon GB37]
MLPEDEYRLDYFKENGFIRKRCITCGDYFWTLDSERLTCGDAPCDPYTFIGSPVFRKRFSLGEMRERYLSFFEERGHQRVDRYPVVARWRDDIYLTIASIADFQPFVTSGLVPPPANPLTISQPCIRLGDLDAVGRSGRHLTLFEMMAHHAFNTRDEEIYWKEETVESCDALLHELGADPIEITYKEAPWAGGGNAGPCLEVIIGGLELATLVFMNLRQKRDGSITIKGERYEAMENYIVDTGYGLERFVWASSGTPTIYDAVFPGIVRDLMDLAGIRDSTVESEYESIFGASAIFAGIMDISGEAKLLDLRKRVAEEIGVTVEELQSIMEPVEAVYAIADHTRCITFMLGDGIIPSNVKAGYLARLVIRRTMRLMHELGLETPLEDIIEMQVRDLTDYPEFRERFETMSEILALEEERYRETLSRGKQLITKMARHYKRRGEAIPPSELFHLYDTHGIPPEMARDVASKMGVSVSIPDTFYSHVAELHTKSEPEETQERTINLAGLPASEKLYYERPRDSIFTATVQRVLDEGIVLDRTLFYPEGGGQPADHGTLTIDNQTVKIVDVQEVNGVILHTPEREHTIKEGEMVTGEIEIERRMAHTRHHTATHLVNEAAKKVLGEHVWQTGAQKSRERARLDITHYRRITPDELREIELIANQEVMADQPVETRWMDRRIAEQRYGFTLYQGGVPPGRRIRVVKVGDDVEACAGTHVEHTGEIGEIKILRVERIQDGVERIEFAAGEAAVIATQEREELLNRASNALHVPPEHLPKTAQRFFTEWKELKKEVERLQNELAEIRVTAYLKESTQIKDINVITKEIKRAKIDELIKTAIQLAKHPKTVAILAAQDKGAKIVASASNDTIKRGIDAGKIIQQISPIIGGSGGGKPTIAQGGGKHPEKINTALHESKNIIEEILSQTENT